MAPIPPALSPDEWKERRVQFQEFPELVLHDDGDGMELVVYPDAATAHTRQRMLDKFKFILWEDRHAFAALMLSEHPHGFTRENVDMLRWAAANWTRIPFAMGGFGSLSQPDPTSALTDLADKIDALLPPPEDA